MTDALVFLGIVAGIFTVICFFVLAQEGEGSPEPHEQLLATHVACFAWLSFWILVGAYWIARA